MKMPWTLLGKCLLLLQILFECWLHLVIIPMTERQGFNSAIYVNCEFWLLQWFLYASVNSTCAKPPPPPGWTPGISIFFALDGKFPGVRTLELSNPPGWGRKKRANAPSSVNTATFFIDRTVKYCRFKHFNVRFFGLINVFFVIARGF